MIVIVFIIETFIGDIGITIIAITIINIIFLFKLCFENSQPSTPSDWIGEFQLRIAAVTTAGPSALTLDDITFSNCQVPNTTMVCLSNQITCAQTGESFGYNDV